jgi:hypothetical protein
MLGTVHEQPSRYYQRAVSRFFSDDKIDIAKLTPITYSLNAKSRFVDQLNHDLPDQEDRGYITFHDQQNSRFLMTSYISILYVNYGHDFYHL